MNTTTSWKWFFFCDWSSRVEQLVYPCPDIRDTDSVQKSPQDSTYLVYLTFTELHVLQLFHISRIFSCLLLQFTHINVFSDLAVHLKDFLPANVLPSLAYYRLFHYSMIV